MSIRPPRGTWCRRWQHCAPPRSTAWHGSGMHPASGGQSGGQTLRLAVRRTPRSSGHWHRAPSDISPAARSPACGACSPIWSAPCWRCCRFRQGQQFGPRGGCPVGVRWTESAKDTQRAASIALLVMLAVLAIGGWLAGRATGNRRARGGWWWRVFGAPLAAEPARECVQEGKQLDLIRGASAAGAATGRDPPDDATRKVLTENLGQPGFPRARYWAPQSRCQARHRGGAALGIASP